MSAIHVVKLYSVKDTATGLYGPLMECHSDAEAIRSLKAFARSDVNNIFSSSPDDFSLWRLGSLEKETGMFTSEQEMLCRVSALLDAPSLQVVA